jgi:hypothetical protein
VAQQDPEASYNPVLPALIKDDLWAYLEKKSRQHHHLTLTLFVFVLSLHAALPAYGGWASGIM